MMQIDFSMSSGVTSRGLILLKTTEAIPLRYCFYALSDACVFCYKVDDGLFRDAPHTPVSVGSELT